MDENKQDENDGIDLNIIPLKTKKSKLKSNGSIDSGIIPKPPCSMLITGASGSGKTQLVLNLLTRKEFYKGFFDYIFIFSNTAGEADDLYDHLDVDKDHIFLPNKGGLKQLEHIIETQKKIIKDRGIDKSPSILLLCDDIANERKFISSDTYLKLHIMCRHWNITIISLFQSYMKCNRSCRIQVNALFYFKGKASETERIASEHTPSGYTEKEFLQIVKHASNEPYSFLFVNYCVPHAERYRKNLNTLLRLTK